MEIDSAIASEVCRYLFRVGGATASFRHQFLDGLSAAAISAQLSGGSISATSANGASVQLQFFEGWSPLVTLRLVTAARAWADCADLATALATIGTTSRVSYASFAGASL